MGEQIRPETVGALEDSTIPVEIGTRFLEHFSEQLYSSPQKAFEELISNGWDAGADCVYVKISNDLKSPNATMCVLDNGHSMDFAGLKALWHIAFSPKANQPEIDGRRVIGKFGIGKLATYVLANKLTYLCKAKDGIIRRVTMDYGKITQNTNSDQLVSQQSLSVYDVNEADLELALKNIDKGDEIFQLIKEGIPKPNEELAKDEFGAAHTSWKRVSKDTWTLVVLSDLKDAGKQLKTGILNRMLESALPIGAEMAIDINGSLLKSSKVDMATITGCDWKIGRDLGFDFIEIDVEKNESNEDSESINETIDGENAKSVEKEKLVISFGADSDGSFISLPEVGKITGRVRLFIDKISGGKSDERGASNGFHVNVLGRVVNQKDTSFGEANLSHAAWARFRMAVRADGLNDCLTTNREQFKENRKLKIFKAFLRRVFNKARTMYDSDLNANMIGGGDILVRSLGVISLSPLRNIVSESLRTKAPLPDMFDESNIEDKEQKRIDWQKQTADNIKSALDEVKYEKIEDDSFAKFRLSDNSIIVNKDHPFVAEHTRSRAEKQLVRTIAMVNFLVDVYSLDIGVEPSIIENIRKYRDQLMRFRSLEQRQSGTLIAKLLLQTQHLSDQSKQLEKVVSEALKYLGFQVKDLANSGEPEGIASAFVIPTPYRRTSNNPTPLYTFTFDAKSSKYDTATTGNLNLDGLKDHRIQHQANYTLVVAPGFTGDAVIDRCKQQEVTPMTARDLGLLLEYTVQYGAIPLNMFQEVFSFHDHREVSNWVQTLKERLSSSRPLTIDIFLKTLESLKGKVPNSLSADLIAFQCSELFQAYQINGKDVTDLVRGLAILIPDLIGVNDDKIIVNASAERVAEAIKTQLENMHSIN